MKEGSRASFPLLLSFPRTRESIFTWQGGCLTDTNRRMDARMDSRFHGNDGKKSPDGKRPPLSPPRKEGDMKEGGRYEGREPGVIPAPSVIPAKAGIHPHVARRVSGRHKQTDGFSDGFPFPRE